MSLSSMKQQPPTVRFIHPCFVSDNATSVFAPDPSVTCVSLYVFLGLMSLCTVCGNLLVVVSVSYFKQLHTPTHYLVLSLAVADLLVGVVVSPFSMAVSVTSCLHRDDLLCKIRDSFDVSLCTSSILHLCCVSVDRYYAVCQPLTYRSKMNVHVTLTMILATWGVSLLIGVGIISAGFSQGACEGTCSVDVAAANTLGPVFSFYLPAAVMLCIYLKVFLVAQRQARTISRQAKQSGAGVSKMERKATRTLATVMGVFLLCLTPYFLCVLLQPLARPPPAAAAAVTEALNWLTLSNSMLNPLIYAVFYSWFRAAFRIVASGRIFQGGLANAKLSV